VSAAGKEVETRNGYYWDILTGYCRTFDDEYWWPMADYILAKIL
jgi:hypothetical protein